jgi:hypothetical protein
MMARLGTACLLMLGVLWGCALFPIGEAECKPPSWQQRGYDDGFGGAPPQDLRLVKECRERFGVEVPQKAYLAGYREGYIEYERLHPSGNGMRPKGR